MTVSRAILTGGSGFIGAHVARRLLDEGVALTLLLRASSDLGRLRDVAGDALGRAVVRRVALTSAEDVRREALAARPDAIFHVAGDARARAPEEESAAMIAAHRGAAQSLARAAIDAGARLVAISTSDVYGHLPSPHASEGPLDPRTPYARSRAAADELLAELHRTEGLDVVILRPYIVYGAAQAPRQLVPAVIAACLEERPFPMSDGEQRRDFLFVDDVARAIVRAGDAPGVAGRVIDLCSGEPTRVVDVALAIAAQIRPAHGGPLPGALPRSAHEPADHFGDPTLADALLGLAPRVPLNEGLARTIAAFKSARRAQGPSL